MKKWMSLILVALLLSAGTAFAGTTVDVQESSPFFDLSIDLPEGGTCDQAVADDVTLGTIKLAGAAEGSIGYFFTVGFSDLCTGRSLSEFGEEELDAFFRSAAAVEEGEETTASYAIKELDDGVRAPTI